MLDFVFVLQIKLVICEIGIERIRMKRATQSFASRGQQVLRDLLVASIKYTVFPLSHKPLGIYYGWL